MTIVRAAVAVVAMTICVIVVAPVIIRAVHALLIPGAVGVVLYLAVRLVHAHLNRW